MINIKFYLLNHALIYRFEFNQFETVKLYDSGCVLFFQISYCQGMSDIASPILAVMDNEAHAFICFCGIMKRLEGNFRPDGQLMSIKFQHLKLLLQYSDPEFYSYLVSRGADDLFFCYRWLLLELKREFAFEDALRMLEITWSSLPPDPPETEVDLFGSPLHFEEIVSCRDKDRLVQNFFEDEAQKEKQRRRHMLRPSRDESYVSKNDIVGSGSRNEGNCAIPQIDLPSNSSERKTSFADFNYYSGQSEDSFDMDNQQPLGLLASESGIRLPRHQSTVDSEDDLGERMPLIKNYENSLSSPLIPAGQPIWKMSLSVSPMASASPSGGPSWSSDSSLKSQATTNGEAFSRTVPKTLISSGGDVLCNTGIYFSTIPTVKSIESPCHSHQSLMSSPILTFGRGQSLTSTKPYSLPPPQEFGKGNPFMLFLCLSILLEHRDHIIKNCLDYNELAMHFDRLVRRHNLSRVLQRAKALFADYLQSEVWDSEEGDEVSLDSPTVTRCSVSSGMSARPIHSPLASPQSSSYSTYNLVSTIPSSAAQGYFSSTT